jgi:hypothetical protein
LFRSREPAEEVNERFVACCCSFSEDRRHTLTSCRQIKTNLRRLGSDHGVWLISGQVLVPSCDVFSVEQE